MKSVARYKTSTLGFQTWYRGDFLIIPGASSHSWRIVVTKVPVRSIERKRMLEVCEILQYSFFVPAQVCALDSIMHLHQLSRISIVLLFAILRRHKAGPRNEHATLFQIIFRKYCAYGNKFPFFKQKNRSSGILEYMRLFEPKQAQLVS